MSIIEILQWMFGSQSPGDLTVLTSHCLVWEWMFSSKIKILLPTTPHTKEFSFSITRKLVHRIPRSKHWQQSSKGHCREWRFDTNCQISQNMWCIHVVTQRTWDCEFPPGQIVNASIRCTLQTAESSWDFIHPMFDGENRKRLMLTNILMVETSNKDHFLGGFECPKTKKWSIWWYLVKSVYSCNSISVFNCHL